MREMLPYWLVYLLVGVVVMSAFIEVHERKNGKPLKPGETLWCVCFGAVFWPAVLGMYVGSLFGRLFHAMMNGRTKDDAR